MEIKQVFIVGGGGVMGSGVAQVCAQSGYSVIMQDINTKAQAKALENIKDAIKLCLEVRSERGLPLTVETFQVEVLA